MAFLFIKQLRHDNLVNLLEVWKRRRRWYLVFEFVERTLLDDLEANPNGLDLDTSRQYLYQILRAAAFCHKQHVRTSVCVCVEARDVHMCEMFPQTSEDLKVLYLQV